MALLLLDEKGPRGQVGTIASAGQAAPGEKGHTLPEQEEAGEGREQMSLTPSLLVMG